MAGRNALCLVGASLRGPGHGPGLRDDIRPALADPYLRWIAPARSESDGFGWLPAAADAG